MQITMKLYREVLRSTKVKMVKLLPKEIMTFFSSPTFGISEFLSYAASPQVSTFSQKLPSCILANPACWYKHCPVREGLSGICSSAILTLGRQQGLSSVAGGLIASLCSSFQWELLCLAVYWQALPL